MQGYLGDFRTGKTVRGLFNTNAVAGESITRATDGTISVYKNGGTTQSTAGVTGTEDFDSLTGVHLVTIDTSADGTFYSAGADFHVVLSAATIDGKTINAFLFSFSIENRSALMPTTDGRKVDIDASGGVEVGSFQAGAITAAAIATDAIDADALADNAITAATFAAGAIVAAEIADGAIAAATFAADAGSGLTAVPWNSAWDAEVQSEVQDAIEANHLDHLLAADYDPASKPGVSTALLNELVENDGGVSRYTANALVQGPSGGGGGLDAAGVRAAVGLASANLDTQLDAIPTAIENADALLKRDMSAVTGEAARSPLNALRFLRNAWTVIAGVLSVKKEDDSTEAWASTVSSDAAADPITGSNPS